MQPENDKKSTDGGRLEKLKASTGKTWVQIAGALGISRSMLFSVVAGEKRLGRDKLDALAKIEHGWSSQGGLSRQHKVDSCQDQSEAYKTTDMLLAENAALKAELKQALETISNLSKALARRGEGRAQADGPPANPACDACSGTAPMDQSKSA